MIPELGHYALFLALSLAAMQVIVPLWGARIGDAAMMQLSRYTACGQFLFAGLSLSALGYALLTNDFSVAYVAQNSNTHLPKIYQFCAIWGAHEGSLLLWVFILTGWMTAVSFFSRSLPLPVLARVLAVLAVIAAGFYLFLLSTSNPFIRLWPNTPSEGADLNPILQDPGLSVHPPILYMGYVGFAVPFAFAMAALLSGRLDVAWTRWSRPWTTLAWCFLTLGIVLGSAWAYRELGWGGWWFWDPVENASFLPWLAGTALIHSLAVTEKRQLFKAWMVLLSVCAFSLSLLGTFLVRSGVLISVHSFASDPKRGLFMLGFLMFVIGGSLAIYTWRGRQLVSASELNPSSRETLLLINNILLFTAMLTVLLGTLYPLMMDVLHFNKLSVGAPYFNLVFTPLMVPIFILMAIAPLFQWQNASLLHFKKKLIIYFIFVIMLALLLPMIFGAKITFWVFLGLALAFWVILWTAHHGMRRLGRSQWAMILAHLGVGVTAIGIICTTAYTQQRDISMRPGDTVSVGPYEFRLITISDAQGPNYQSVRGKIEIYRKGAWYRTLYPEQRYFSTAQTVTTKAAIDANIIRDLYVAIGSRLPNGAWSLRIYYKPFIRWIWGGGVMMALGGILAVTDRRYRRRKSPCG